MDQQEAFVYFMRHESMPIVKIGKAVNLENRWRQLGGSFDYQASHFVRCASEEAALQLERRLHRAFRESRFTHDERFDGHTEWFDAAVMTPILVLVDGIEPIERPEPVIVPRVKRARPEHDRYCWHWEYELRQAVLRARDECQIRIEGEVLKLEGPNAVECGKQLRSFGVLQNGLWFGVFGSIAYREGEPHAELTVHNAPSLRLFADLLA